MVVVKWVEADGDSRYVRVFRDEVLQREQRHLFEIYNGGDDMAEDIKLGMRCSTNAHESLTSLNNYKKFNQ